jgi:hypothetical protein
MNTKKTQFNMKKFISFSVLTVLLASCGGSGDKGELVGAKGRKALWDDFGSWRFIYYG